MMCSDLRTAKPKGQYIKNIPEHGFPGGDKFNTGVYHFNFPRA